MKQVRDQVWPLAHARGVLGDDVDAPMLRFLVERLGYHEVRYEDEAVHHPGYVPAPDLLADLWKEVKRGAISVRRCGGCSGCFDIDRAEGAFGDYEGLQRFVCRPCAEGMSAWTFWERFVAS